MKKINVFIISNNVYFNHGVSCLIKQKLSFLMSGYDITTSIKNTFRDASLLLNDNDHLVVIMELATSEETLYEGLQFITQTQQKYKNVRIIVITRHSNPLVLKAISNRHPSVIMLQQEPLNVISQYLGITLSTFYSNDITLLSPIASSILSYARDLKCTPKELDIVVCQQDGLSLKDTAKMMNIPYKNVSFLKCNLTKKLGLKKIDSYTTS